MSDEIVELLLEPAGGAAGRARRAVREWLSEVGVPTALCDDVVLVVSELVTNAALHARTTARVVVGWDGDRVLIEVFDGDAHPPALLDEVPAVGGWGLHLVDRLSTMWGSDAQPPGKRVWAEMAVDR